MSLSDSRHYRRKLVLSIVVIFLCSQLTHAFLIEPSTLVPSPPHGTMSSTTLTLKSPRVSYNRYLHNVSRRLQHYSVSPRQNSQTSAKRPRPIFLTHERDFFRQEARLDSMDSYVLVSTLTASMSFGCLVGYAPHAVSTHAMKFYYPPLCLAIQIVSGLSSLCGLYATIIFSLTILYGKSALGAERDREYDKFLRRTVRARVHGARCFSWSLGLFAIEAWLMLVERTILQYCAVAVPLGFVGAFILYHLYLDWKLLFQSTEVIYKD